MIVKAGFAKSNGEARRAITQGGVSVNDEKVTDVFKKLTKEEIADGVLLKKGKKNFIKIEM